MIRSTPPDAAARLAVRVDMLDLALGHRTFTKDGATFVVNPAFPRIHDANFLYDVTASTPAEIDRLLARARREYAHASILTVRVTPWTPEGFEARMGLAATERDRTLVMRLEGALKGRPPSHVVRRIEDEADWRALRRLKRESWREYTKPSRGDPSPWDVPDGLAAVARLKSPPVHYALAFLGGKPVGFMNAWPGIDGTGQVEDLFVLAAHRRKGIATALLHHGVADARARGAGPVVICTSVADTPKLMYAAMGWKPVAVCRQYALVL